MAEYLEREAAENAIRNDLPLSTWMKRSVDKAAHAMGVTVDAIEAIPAADVVEEENILKFYYVRSIDEYWIGQRIDNFYYAEYDSKRCQWVWTHSRYLPWGEHIVSPTSLWKEHTYPSEPEEIPFAEWLQGFIKKHAADVVEVRHGRWEHIGGYGYQYRCSKCFSCAPYRTNYCPNCGAKMTEV